MATLVGMNSLTAIKVGPVITKPPILPPVPSGPGYDPEGDFNGGSGNDVLRGTNPNILEIFHGYGGDDMLFGNGGTDWLTGGWGADFIDGGDGANDTVIYDDSPEGVEVNLATGRGVWGTANGDVIVNCEDLVGSNYNDTLIGNDGANRLHGLAGDDTLRGGAGADYLEGYGGRDTADYTDSLAGVTVNLQTGTGFGGTAEGDRLVTIEDLLGSAQADTLIGNEEVNDLWGGGGDDLLKGAGGNDTLEGVSGNDTLKGGGGADILIGGLGINTASYYGSPEAVFVSLQDHLAAGGDATGDQLYNIDNLTGSIYADNLWGNDWNNVISGGDGADSLKGYGGADTLLGGEGNDRLEGMSGADVLTGGNGADNFVWSTTNDTGVTIATADLITDFNPAQGDKIDLSNVDANILVAGNQAFTFIGNAAFTGPGQVNFVQVGGETIIQMQTGQDADVEGIIRIAGLVTPDASWFLL
jgi:Ca2+-binding RTX toxin-like protein